MIQIAKIDILILFASFYDFDILFWNCPDSLVFYVFLDFGTELFRQCGIFCFSRFWNSPDSGIFCFSRFWNCPDSVVFYVFLDFGTELFRQCGRFCFSRFWNIPDSVVFFVFLDFGTVLTVWYFMFF